MKILIHGINFSPELTGVGKYTGEMADWLAKSGHDVRVVTAQPYYPQWKIADGYSNSWNIEVAQGIGSLGQDEGLSGSLVIYRCPLWVPKKPSGIKRLLHLASFAFSSLPIMLRQIFWRPDLILAVAPPLLCAPQAWLVARLSGAKSWLHIQDFEVDAAFTLGILKANWIRRLFLKVERLILRHFDEVSTISAIMQEKLVVKGVEESRVVLLPNWVNCKEIYPLMRSSEYRAELGIVNKSIIALYSGTMGEKQGLDVVIEAARCFNGNSGFLFVLCGYGPAREKLVAQAHGLKNILWIPLQPTERLNELLNLADFHLLPQRKGMNDLVMPSKLLGMLASGRPVLALADNGTLVSNEVSKYGVVLSPGDVDGLVSTLLRLAKMPDERKRMGEAARTAAGKWSKETVLREFELELKKLYES